MGVDMAKVQTVIVTVDMTMTMRMDAIMDIDTKA